MNNLSLLDKTPAEINSQIAENVKKIRKRRKISQKKLSELSGVSLGSLKRFEQTGEISLISLTKIAFALGLESEMEALFSEAPFLSIEEIMNEQD